MSRVNGCNKICPNKVSFLLQPLLLAGYRSLFSLSQIMEWNLKPPSSYLRRDSPNSFPCFRMIFTDKTYLTNPNLQLQVFEEVSKVCPDVLALRDNDFLLRLFLDFLERLHTEADLAVLDSDDFDSHFVANAQHI